MIKYNEHKVKNLPRTCTAQDLFLVSEGVQCGNCLVLIYDYREEHNVSDKKTIPPSLPMC